MLLACAGKYQLVQNDKVIPAIYIYIPRGVNIPSTVDKDTVFWYVGVVKTVLVF
jgi:hypothetical protein